MGAENSILEGCEWGEPIVGPPTLLWKLTPITKPDGNQVTVFEPKNAEKKDGDLLRKSAANLKALRHPNIVRYIECGDGPESFWLATESVTPLMTALPSMTSEELIAGLYEILVGLQFLHERLGMCHNNLCLSSLYISPDGVWKLGGLEHACKFPEATQEYLDRCRAFRVESTLAPEEKTNSVTVEASKGHARDIYALGVLVDALMDSVLEKDDLSQSVDHQLSSCISSDPSSRPKTSQLLKLSFFESDLVDIIGFLKNITIKSDTEKKLFFSNLLPRLSRLPELVIARRLVIPLLARFVLLDEWADTMVLPHLLMPRKEDSTMKSALMQGLLSESIFQEYVTGHLYKILRVHDCHIRLVLLQHFSNYVHLFTKEQLEDDIFIQILLGLRDTDDKLVAASLRALADLVPLLGGDVIIGGNRKSFFFHGLPKQVSPEDLKVLPRNVNTVMSHSQAKPLLKDLAAGGRSSFVIEEDKQKLNAEKEKKLKEREQRREEARLKREERKKRLKEKSVEKDEHVLIANGISNGLTIEEADSLDQKEALPNQDSDDDLKKVGDGGDDDEENPDWSDWENPDKDIEDEIEAELSKMDNAVDSDPEGKVQTSPSPYRSHSPPAAPPVKINWSDIQDIDKKNEVNRSHHSGGGKLTLKSHKASKDKEDSKNGTLTTHPDTVVNEWGDTDTRELESESKTVSPSHNKTRSPAASSKSLKLKSKTATSVSKQQTRKPGPLKDDDFGYGYDIKSIEIKAKSVAPEDDFFADMVPSIPKTTTDIFSAISSVEDSKSQDSASTDVTETPVKADNSKIFAVAVDDIEEAAGWGNDEDLDWGNDAF